MHRIPINAYLKLANTSPLMFRVLETFAVWCLRTVKPPTARHSTTMARNTFVPAGVTMEMCTLTTTPDGVDKLGDLCCVQGESHAMAKRTTDNNKKKIQTHLFVSNLCIKSSMPLCTSANSEPHLYELQSLRYSRSKMSGCRNLDAEYLRHGAVNRHRT